MTDFHADADADANADADADADANAYADADADGMKNTIWDGGSTAQIIGFLGLTDWTIEMHLGLNCV